MNSICVCGSGTMGQGIAQVAAAGGYTVILYDVSAGAVVKAKEATGNNLQVLVSKQKLTTAQRDDLLQRLHFTSSMADCKADLVIEAIVENAAIKQQLFGALSAINSSDTIFASNTSSLSITALAGETTTPQRFAGLHFFNPAPLMKLVEVVRGEATSGETIDRLVAFTKSLGKVPVVCKDAPGFIVNRVARPYYIEALRLAEAGIDYKTIDQLLQAAGFKLGPFSLMDLIGNDINYAVSYLVWEQLGRPERLRPSHLQQQKMESGALGKKAGKGFYEY